MINGDLMMIALRYYYWEYSYCYGYYSGVDDKSEIETEPVDLFDMCRWTRGRAQRSKEMEFKLALVS